MFNWLKRLFKKKNTLCNECDAEQIYPNWVRHYGIHNYMSLIDDTSAPSTFEFWLEVKSIKDNSNVCGIDVAAIKNKRLVINTDSLFLKSKGLMPGNYLVHIVKEDTIARLYLNGELHDECAC